MNFEEELDRVVSTELECLKVPSECMGAKKALLQAVAFLPEQLSIATDRILCNQKGCLVLADIGVLLQDLDRELDDDNQYGMWHFLVRLIVKS